MKYKLKKMKKLKKLEMYSEYWRECIYHREIFNVPLQYLNNVGEIETYSTEEEEL